MRTLCVFLTSLIFWGCMSKSRTEWSLAIASNNSKYESCSVHLKELFSQKGLDLTIIRAASTVEAAQMVAEGKADFTLSLSQSDFLFPKLGSWVKDLRTVMPMFENAMFIFYRATHSPKSIIDLVEGSKIFLEVPDTLSEQYLGLKRVFSMLNVDNYEFVNDSAEATLIPIWGTFSGELAKKMLNRKWNLYSMEDSFIEYALIIEPRFGQLTVPIRYSMLATKGMNTLLTTAYLISGEHIDRTELYDVITMIYDNRVLLTAQDRSYMAIREDFGIQDLNFPLHAATVSYLRRDEPSILERHAELYGLLLTIFVLAFGLVQWVRNYLAQKKKDRIDQYFQEYMAIKNDLTITASKRIDLLESLRAKAIQQMILEKLDISDFSVFNQAIESERILLRGSSGEAPKA